MAVITGPHPLCPQGDDSLPFPTLLPETLAWLRTLPGPIYPIGVMGLGRNGKSETLNQLVKHIVPGASIPQFKVSDEPEPCTIGADFLALPRPGKHPSLSGGTYLFIDTEGTDNLDTQRISRIIALFLFMCGGSAGLFVDGESQGRLINAMSALIQTQWFVSAEEANTRIPAPALAIVQNCAKLKISDKAAYLEKMLADNPKDKPNNTTRDLIRRSFPRRQLFSLPNASEADRQSPASPYGVELLNLVAFVDQHNSAVFLDGDDFADRLEGLAKALRDGTLPEPRNPLEEMVRARCDELTKQLMSARRTALEGEPLSGREPLDSVRERFRQLEEETVQEFSAQTRRYPAELIQKHLDSLKADLAFMVDDLLKAWEGLSQLDEPASVTQREIDLGEVRYNLKQDYKWQWFTRKYFTVYDVYRKYRVETVVKIMKRSGHCFEKESSSREELRFVRQESHDGSRWFTVF